MTLGVAASVAVIGAVAGIGALTAHAAAPRAVTTPGRTTSMVAGPGPSDHATMPVSTTGVPAHLAGTPLGRWTTTDADGRATVHDVARGVVTQCTPAVLTVRTATHHVVSFAITSAADTVREFDGGRARTVQWSAIHVGEHVTVTGVIPTSTGVPAIRTVSPAS